MQAMAGKQLQNWSSLKNEGHLKLKVSANANVKIEAEDDARDKKEEGLPHRRGEGNSKRSKKRDQKYLFHSVMLKKTQREGKQRRHFPGYTN